MTLYRYYRIKDSPAETKEPYSGKVWIHKNAKGEVVALELLG